MSKKGLLQNYSGSMGPVVRAYVVEFHNAARSVGDLDAAIRTGRDLYQDTMSAYTSAVNVAGSATHRVVRKRAHATAQRLNARLNVLSDDLDTLTLQNHNNKQKGGQF